MQREATAGACLAAFDCGYVLWIAADRLGKVGDGEAAGLPENPET